jgi:hypothetical protein
VSRGGGSGDADHLADAGGKKCRPGRREGGPGGYHIVDQQHLQSLTDRARAELGRLQALGPRVPGLGRTMAAEEQAPTRQRQFVGDRTGQQFGLVVPPSVGAGSAGGRPGDDIEPSAPLTEAQAVHRDVGQVAGHAPPVAVLQAVHHLAGDPLERQRGEDATIAHLDGGTGQREAATTADDGTGLVAAGAGSVEHHGAISTRGL